MTKGTLYMIPTTIGGEGVNDVIPVDVQQQCIQIRHFIVENIKTTRRYFRRK